jgi:hypothetical protein
MKLNSDDMEMYAARSLGLNDNLLDMFRKERDYRKAVSEYKNYNKWKATRNKTRYEMEEKFQMDCKHVMHLVRLYLQCEQLLKTGKLVVFRDDAEFLLSIRNGAWTYEQIIEFADKKDKELELLYKSSFLPKEPDRKLINNTIIDIIDRMSFRS